LPFGSSRETAIGRAWSRPIQAWLSKHPGIDIVSRDRGGGYGEAAAKALPNAIQVADRWHLMENASVAFLDAVRRSISKIRTAIGANLPLPLAQLLQNLLKHLGRAVLAARSAGFARSAAFDGRRHFDGH
jgi:hypothetical protein